MKICILSLNAFNALSKDKKLSHIGGAETQIVSLARGLVQREHDVSIITLDHGQSENTTIDGIHIIKAFRPETGIPVLRFIWPRMTSVWRALSHADADVCLQPCADSLTGLAARWCRKRNRIFCFVAMSDSDCDANLPGLRTLREKVLFRYGLKRSDCVVSQTEVQQRMFRENFGVDSIVIRPCSPIPTDMRDDESKVPQPPHHVVWIGRFSYEKRLEWYLNFAESCPELICHVVGGSNQKTEELEQLVNRAKSIGNVVLEGFVPYAEMDAVYRNATALVMTSRYEGYPTVFIEAWARGIPTFTTFDPDGIVAKYELCGVAKDVTGLARAVKDVLGSPDRYRRIVANARRFYADNHTVDATASGFEALLEPLIVANGVP